MSKASATKILLKNGVVLNHDADNHVMASKKGVLIEDGTIARIGVNIGSNGMETQLKGRRTNECLLKYMVAGNIQLLQFSPEDVFYGQPAGMLGGIAAGTTTVIDHAHFACSPDHAKLAIAATMSSGIRPTFCYTPIMRTFDELADKRPFGEGRVELGFAFGLFLPTEIIKGLLPQVKGKGVKPNTCHGSTSLEDVVQSLKGLELLDESIIISPRGGIRSADAELIMNVDAHPSSTSSSKLHMMENARNKSGEYHMKHGKIPRTVPESLGIEAALNLATIKRAEAANKSDEMGRIAEGFRAGLVVFDALSLFMIAAAQQDPVVRIILHSTPADIDTVIVNGIIRKRYGKLLPVSINEAERHVTSEIALNWTMVARKVVSSRARMQNEMGEPDFAQLAMRFASYII